MPDPAPNAGAAAALVTAAQTNAANTNNSTSSSTTQSQAQKPQQSRTNTPGTSTTTGGNTQQNNNNNNNNNNNASTTSTNNNRPRFMGAIVTLPVLMHRAETTKKDQFLIYNRKLKTHVVSTFEFLADILPATQNLEDPKVEFFKNRPTRQTAMTQHHLTSPLSTDDREYLDCVLKQEQEQFSDRLEELEQNTVRLFGVSWGQCSQALQEEVKLDPLYRLKSRQQDGVWLLQTLRGICSGVDRRANQYLMTFQQCQEFFNLKQYRNETADEYYRWYRSMRDTLTLLGAEVAAHQHLITLEGGFMDMEASKEKFYAVAFLANSDNERYADLMTHLSNQMLQGYDNYPQNLQAAFELLGRWENVNAPTTSNTNANYNNNNNRRRRNRRGQGRGGGGDGGGHGPNVQLAQITTQDTKPSAGYNNVVIPNTFCSGCQQYGHAFAFCRDNL